MKVVVVNATALDASGALTVLRQFVVVIPQTDIQWIIFVSDKIDISASQYNVRLVPIDNVKSLYKRFMWDAFGVKKWLKKNGIVPFASMSLQNTNFRTGYKIPNYIYYHQSIPFFQQRWSVFKKEQRSLWFYKNIYPFFVRLLLNSNTEVFVQLEFIKQGFSKRFAFPTERIHLVFPEVKMPDKKNIELFALPYETLNLFYPATSFFYKNHVILYEALKELGGNKATLYTTLERTEIPQALTSVRALGKISFMEVLTMYASADALVFPSYIETLGLPLIEAATLGLPILVADLPYAREALQGYEGAIFIPRDKSSRWADAIQKLKKGKRYKPFAMQSRASWQELFELITDRK